MARGLDWSRTVDSSPASSVRPLPRLRPSQSDPPVRFDSAYRRSCERVLLLSRQSAKCGGQGSNPQGLPAVLLRRSVPRPVPGIWTWTRFHDESTSRGEGAGYPEDWSQPDESAERHALPIQARRRDNSRPDHLLRPCTGRDAKSSARSGAKGSQRCERIGDIGTITTVNR